MRDAACLQSDEQLGVEVFLRRLDAQVVALCLGEAPLCELGLDILFHDQ